MFSGILGQMIGACGSTVRNATSSVSKTNHNITITWEVPSYNVCKTIHILVSAVCIASFLNKNSNVIIRLVRRTLLTLQW